MRTMEAFLGEKAEKRGLNKGFIIGIVIGVIAIAADNRAFVVAASVGR